MILTGLLFAGTVLATTLAVTFWDDLKVWVVGALRKLIKTISGVVHGVKVFIEKMHRAYKEVSKTYSQNERKQWMETIQTREIPENQVPPEILAKVKQSNQTYDITNQFEKELELVL